MLKKRFKPRKGVTHSMKHPKSLLLRLDGYTMHRFDLFRVHISKLVHAHRKRYLAACVFLIMLDDCLDILREMLEAFHVLLGVVMALVNFLQDGGCLFVLFKLIIWYATMQSIFY